MPPLVCPRCQSTNPEFAAYCYNDGVVLRAGVPDAGSVRLAHEFIFPSGRRCRTFEELAQACQEEWDGARDLLKRGVFHQYFTACGRHDLARNAQEAGAQPDPNLALANFVNSLPGTRAAGPRLDLNPRRLHLGNVLAGESRHVEMTVNNRGQGVLHGTVTVTEGGNWLRLGGSSNGQCDLHAPREQRVQLQVETRGLPAGQSYGGKLTVVTNGGVVEVPVRLDLAAHPFARPPFQGARAPREMAEKMRAQPKAASPLLESGDVARWFASNGWNYPVPGNPVRGVAGVQQFFECLGLSKPPEVKLSQAEVRCDVTAAAPLRSQVTLLTAAKKWVYANVESDSPWLTPVATQVTGPQKAEVAFDVDPRALPPGRPAEGSLRLQANGGQVLTLRVSARAVGAAAGLAGTAQATMKMPPVAQQTMKISPAATATPAGIVTPQVMRARPAGPDAVPTPMRTPARVGFLTAVLGTALAFCLLRLLLAPLADGYARSAAADAAAHKHLPQLFHPGGPLESYGGWLSLPWPSLLLGGIGLVDGGPGVQDPSREFRDEFVRRFVLILILGTAWVGAVAGAIVLGRRGGLVDALWGLVAGGFAGLGVSATLACLLLAGDLVPHLLWSAILSGQGGAGLVPVWILLAVLCWAGLGAALGLVLSLLGPLGRPLLASILGALAGALRWVGLRGLAGQFSAQG